MGGRDAPVKSNYQETNHESLIAAGGHGDARTAAVPFKNSRCVESATLGIPLK
jgi:hypothetical protein